jgi:hypothetical protein
MTFEMMINDFSMFLFYFCIVCQNFSLKFGLEVWIVDVMSMIHNVRVHMIVGEKEIGEKEKERERTVSYEFGL